MNKNKVKELSDFQFAVILTLPVVILMTAIIFYPLFYSLLLSVSNVSFFGGYRMVFTGLSNYIEVLGDSRFWHSAMVSLRFTFGSVILTLSVGLAMALVLNRVFPCKNIIRTIAILPWAVSSYGVGVMLSYVLRGRTGIVTAFSYLFGLDQSVDFLSGPAVIEVLALSNAWNLAPLVAFFLMANLENIPKRLYDLAETDRLSGLEKFFNVTLPHIRHTLYIFAAITTVFSLKVFEQIFLQTGGGPGVASTTLTFRIYKETFRNLNLGYGSAMSVLLLLLLLGTTFVLYMLIGRKEAY